MYSLYLDTATKYLSIGIAKDYRLIDKVQYEANKRQSEVTIPELKKQLDKLNLSLSDIGEIVITIGPGSFTGVRIGVALILGLSSGLNKKAYGISSLDVEAIISCKNNLKTASLLKGDVYAVRDYDFSKNIFSEYYTEEISHNINDYTLVNSDKWYFPNLPKAVQSGKLWDFRAECSPIYLRKSEAEINLDKKSNA